MTDHTPLSGTPPVPARRESYLGAGTTVASWLFTTDHKRVAILYAVTLTVFFFIGGAAATLMRIELLTPAGDLVSADDYNKLFTLHGVIMVWFFLVPVIPSTFGNFILPMAVGASDVAFPRLNLLSWYLTLGGGLVALAALLIGGVDTGWTFYTPYSTLYSNSYVSLAAAGVFIAGFGTIATGINMIVTVHVLRARGLRWMRLPLFVWSIYATSIIIVLATPALAVALLMVVADRVFGLAIFDPAQGGDPIIFQHVFWFYSHPAVYIMILPAMGVISEVICTHARKNPWSYRAIAYSSLGIAFVGFLTWGHHMFVSGMSTLAGGVFGVLSMLVAVFSAIKVFTWTGTLYKGSIALTTPMIYFFAFLFLFVFGGMTGVAVAATSLDVHWHDTYFIVAHFHFIMVGGTLTGYLAALHHWFPKITGHEYSERWGLFAALMVFLGFFFTFFPQFLLGNAGMPRRYATYPEPFQVLHVLSTAGATILALGLLVTLLYLLYAMKWGPRAGDNPWGARSLEWETSSPPPQHNFGVDVPAVHFPYDYYAVEEKPR